MNNAVIANERISFYLFLGKQIIKRVSNFEIIVGRGTV